MRLESLLYARTSTRGWIWSIKCRKEIGKKRGGFGPSQFSPMVTIQIGIDGDMRWGSIRALPLGLGTSRLAKVNLQ